MRLNDVEKFILIAERDYRSIQDKLNYVNLRMHYSRIIEGGEIVVNVNCQKLLIKKNVYYRKVGELETKAKVRAHAITRSLLPDLVNEHDTLKEDRKDIREMIVEAKAADNHMAAARLKRDQIDLGQRIFAVKENITRLMEKGNIDNEGELIGEQIRLFTKAL